MVHNPNSSNSNKNYDIDCCKEYKECYGVTKQEGQWTKCSVCESDCVKTAQFSLKPASIVGATAILSILKNVNKKVQLDATICKHLFTAKSLYMFRASQHPSPGALKTVTATSGIGHNTGTATSFQRGLLRSRPRWKEVAVPVL